jgi:transposase InsO family protein
MDQRQEFVLLASQPGAKIAPLARYFGISRKTAYKWLTRYHVDGQHGLKNRTRRPKQFPAQTPSAMENEVVRVRGEHEVWGGRKLRRILQNERVAGTLKGVERIAIPAASTITRILDRHGLIDHQQSEAHSPSKRFERSSPNALVQMDFKGDVMLGNRTKSYPLTMLDDHSRYNLCLQSCPDQRHDTVVRHLRAVFRRYGLPQAMLMDNGTPWAHSYGMLTRIELWLLRLGIQVIHGRRSHPQTQGKEERFHLTLKTEVLNGRLFQDASALQHAFNQWRRVYNFVRPHEAVGLDCPGSHYQVSDRPYPEVLPPVEYDSGEIVRKVRANGYFSFQSVSWFLSETLRGESVALRPTQRDGIYAVCYGAFVVGVLDCTKNETINTPYRRIQRCRSAKQIGSSEHPLMYEGEIIE